MTTKRMMMRARARGATSVSTAIAGVLFVALAFGDTGFQETQAISRQLHEHSHSHNPQSFPVGLDSSATPPEPGSTLRGGELVSYSPDGRGAAQERGGAVGRTIYTGAEAVEPTLGIDKKGNIFFQGARTDGLLFPLVVISRDGGRSWDEVELQTHPHSQDPLIYVDTDTGRAFTADLTFPCITVSHSDDVGQSWMSSQACGITDHQTMFAGPPVSSPTVGYPNVIYMCAMDLGATSLAAFATSCLKSLDGGITWIRTGAPAYTDDPRAGEGTIGIPGRCGGGTGHSFVDTKGVLYLPRGWCGQPYLAMSKDEGATWDRIQIADNGMTQFVSGRLCAGVCHQFSDYEHEAAVAVDKQGNIFYFWVAQDRLPYLAVSRDGGKSFSKPMMIGPPGLKEAWGPTMDVGDTGKIALAYLGSTNAPRDKTADGLDWEYPDSVTWNGYITTSVDALTAKPRFFSATVNDPSDPLIRGSCWGRCGAQFDFIDVVIGPNGRPYTSMVDGCPAPGTQCVSIGPGILGTVVGGPKLR